ncbi:C1 family peptidase [Pseudorhodoferax sp.]|uniref:C1 family peptidase n=1 Tax=Pseudorhodoferax sp. TaxID=1993553 RepID=UPI002DD645B5|nr:C1 family peptidase [Pseudorhodoferax sp.]
MKHLLTKGDAGPDIDLLRATLATLLAADANAFPSLSAPPGSPIDDDFDAAIRRWQSGVGLIADGIVGPRCQVLLELAPPVPLQPPLNVGDVSRLFPATRPANIARYLPYVEAALGAADLTDTAMVIGALGTIRAETEGFVPIAELPSKYNTPPGGAPFSLYDTRKDIGNGAPGDGERYRGRGFVQLTGKANYATYGKRIAIDLVGFPDRANAPEVAAVILAQFLADKATKFRAAVAAGDLRAARRLVNGGSHGLESFSDVFRRAAAIWPPAPARAGTRRGAGKGKAAALAAVKPVADKPRNLRTRKDAADLRDRWFQPVATTLPDQVPTPQDISRFMPGYTGAGLILDQGQEGACTGFGLACVVNYLRWVKAGNPVQMESVSPRMLYTLARRHDEYEGENYDGSSCRGALKGWFNNGVCLESDWPYAPDKSNPARYGFAERAVQHTLGVYYRIDTKSITDMQAAIHQHFAVFVSAFTHDGWNQVRTRRTVPQDHDDLPEVPFDGRPSQDGGHAFALVGFNAKGFIVQNSWGHSWGAGGFGVISYLDWLANGMDAWVVALGVPGVVAGRLAVSHGQAGALAGTDRTKWWDQGLAYQHSVVLGNDGRVSRYLTQDEQPRKLQHQCYVLPDEWFRAQKDKTKRLVLYVHGGLNNEAAAIRRASAMGRYFVANGCYPLFLVWKTGLLESLANILEDRRQKEPALAGAGVGEWLTDKTDLLLEKTIGRPLARPIWSEMKENADLAFAPRRGGDLLLDALQALAVTWGDAFELHVIGHSAGSIALGHLIAALAVRKAEGRDAGLHDKLASAHLYAPACSVPFANARYARNAHVMERLYLDVLSDRVERKDSVAAVYRKSLLYFVSNALETDPRLPLLGLDRIHDPAYSGWDGTSDTGEALAAWRAAAAQAELGKRTTVVDSERINSAVDADGKPLATQAPAHGNFDNDVEVVTRTLQRIRGGRKLLLPVDDLRGY